MSVENAIPFTDETRRAAYLAALEEELVGAKARAAAGGVVGQLTPDQAAQYVADVQAEITRASKF